MTWSPESERTPYTYPEALGHVERAAQDAASIVLRVLGDVHHPLIESVFNELLWTMQQERR